MAKLFTAVFAAGCETGASLPKNTFKYKNGRLSFSLEKKVFSLSVDDITVETAKNAAASYVRQIKDKDEIENFLEILFNGCENGFSFNEIPKEDFMANLASCAIITISSDDRSYDFFLDKDEQNICYMDDGVHYRADTGDFSALYGTYI